MKSLSIREAKANLPMPLLFARLGIANKAMKLCNCPLHDEHRPSFGIFKKRNGDWNWKCFSGCGYGDEVDFLQKHWNISRSDAIRRYIEMAEK